MELRGNAPAAPAHPGGTVNATPGPSGRLISADSHVAVDLPVIRERVPANLHQAFDDAIAAFNEALKSDGMLKSDEPAKSDGAPASESDRPGDEPKAAKPKKAPAGDKPAARASSRRD